MGHHPSPTLNGIGTQPEEPYSKLCIVKNPQQGKQNSCLFALRPPLRQVAGVMVDATGVAVRCVGQRVVHVSSSQAARALPPRRQFRVHGRT